MRRWKHWRRWLFRIHGWVGLTVGLLLFIICLSGTFAVFSNEIDWLAQPSHHVEGRDQPYDWEAMYSNVREAHPDLDILIMQAPRSEGFPGVVAGYPPGSMYTILHMDPYTGEILDQKTNWTVQRFFRGFHRKFFGANLGSPISGLLWATGLGLFLLVSVVTGLLSYKKWWQYFFRLRFDRGWRVFVGDFHKVLGLWCLVISIVIGLTGAWYLLEELEWENSPEFNVPAVTVPDESAPMVDFNEAVKKARAEFKSFEPKRFYPPRNGNPIRIGGHVSGQAWNFFLRPRANRVYVDPVSGEVVKTIRANDHGFWYWIKHAADPLHFGYWGGFITKVIWFVAGLGISLGILTGTIIWYRRRMRQSKSSNQVIVWLYRFGVIFAVLLMIDTAIQGYEQARSRMNLSYNPPVKLSETSMKETEGYLYGIDENDNQKIDHLVYQSRDLYTVLSSIAVPLTLKSDQTTFHTKLELSGYSRLSGRLEPEVPVESMSGSTLIDGDNNRITTISFDNVDQVIENLEHGIHPGHIPVPYYVWGVIGFFVLCVLTAFWFWGRWILLSP